MHFSKKNTGINKDVKKELQRQQRVFQQLEEQIASLTNQRNQSEASLTKPEIYSNAKKFSEAENQYKKASEEIKKLTAQYEEVFEDIVRLEGMINV